MQILPYKEYDGWYWLEGKSTVLKLEKALS